MSLRRSTRIQQAVSPTISSVNNSVIQVQHAAISSTTSKKGRGSKNTDVKGIKAVAHNSSTSRDAIQPEPQLQNRKRRRLSTNEIVDDVDEKSKGKQEIGGNVPGTTPHKRNAPPLPAEQQQQQTPGSTGLAGDGGRRDGAVVEAALPENKVVNKDMVAIASTDSVLEKANAYILSQDPGLADLIERHPCEMFSPAGLQEVIHPFQNLVTGIMAQQVSGAATAAIKLKFINLFTPPAFPTPAQVAAADLSLLRTAGLSGRKAEYVKGLAEKFDSGELTTEMLATASDEEVMSRLTAVRGLGRWSAEMFAFFGLKRTDVFATGDLGVQRGMAVYLGKDVNKLKAKGGGKWKYLSEKEMLDYSAKFSPYRSLFMWYMWKIQDLNINALEQKG